MTQRFPDARMVLASLLGLLLTVLFPSVSVARAGREEAGEPTAAAPQFGVASWHAPGRSRGEGRTASGRPWVGQEMIAAHRSLPFGSRIRVVNLRNGRHVVVQITDRGPFARGRIIDLSRGAAVALDLVSVGCGRVRLEKLPPEQ